MYLPFLMLGYSGALVVLLIGCRLAAKAIPSLAGVRDLTWAVVSAIAAVVLVGLRPWAPAFVSIFIGNCGLFASYVLLYRAVASVLEEGQKATSWLVGLCAVALAPFSFYAFVRPETASRIVIVCVAEGMVSGATAALLFRHRSTALGPSTGVIGCVQVISSVVLFSRAGITLAHHPSNFVGGDWVQTGFTYGQLMTFLSTSCGMLWLSICRFQSELEELAMTDGLTGLLNRRSFDELLTRDLHRSCITGQATGLMLVDIDYFKPVNDRYGHPIGDLVIRRVAEVLKQGLRPEDSLARYGGEEFAILLRRVSTEELASIAERLRVSIEQTEFGPDKIRITASLGVVAGSVDSVLELMDRCDQALYESKRTGRNRVTFGAEFVADFVPGRLP
jgi:diguanylate cyclase (GGDEF)-like protein